MERLNSNQEAILSVLSHALFDYPLEDVVIEDYDAFFNEAYAQAVLPLTYAYLSEKLPENVLKKWQVINDCVLYNNVMVDCEHYELDSILDGGGVPYAIIKGSVSGSYYPHPSLRAMGDVDFFVKPEDMERAQQRLENAGYVRKTDEDHAAHVTFYRPPHFTVEMHWNLNGIPEGENGDIVRSYLSEFVDRAVVLSSRDGRKMMAVEPFHHGLVLLIHTARHLIKSGIGLRHLCDWAVFVNSFSDDDFLDIFEEKLKKCGLWHFAEILTQLCVRYLHCRPCSWVGECDETIAEQVLSDIFQSGNFGRKEESRFYKTALITNSENGMLGKRSMISNIFGLLNKRAKQLMPACVKVKALLPIGWVYVSGRYAVKWIFGRKPKASMQSVISDAKKRQKCYDSFRLFQ